MILPGYDYKGWTLDCYDYEDPTPRNFYTAIKGEERKLINCSDRFFEMTPERFAKIVDSGFTAINTDRPGSAFWNEHVDNL